jgi:hypothetical protein
LARQRDEPDSLGAAETLGAEKLRYEPGVEELAMLEELGTLGVGGLTDTLGRIPVTTDVGLAPFH